MVTSKKFWSLLQNFYKNTGQDTANVAGKILTAYFKRPFFENAVFEQKFQV